MFGDEGTGLGSEPLSLVSDVLASTISCFAVTLRLLCCRRASAVRRSSNVDIAEYHAPTAAPVVQSVAGSPERSQPSGTATHDGRQHREDHQPLLKVPAVSASLP